MKSLPVNEFPLWPFSAPGSLGNAPGDIPTLTPYLPDADIATGASLVIFPGGGYEGLASHEGSGYADFFLKYGITCFVLKYRLASDGYRHPRMLEDAARAVRLVRSKAADWLLDPRRVGVIGSSAGGHLTSMLVTRFDAGNPVAADPVDREGCRPDLAILCYPLITMGASTHAGSKENLLGKNAPPGLARELSSEFHVTPQTPPCLLWHTWEDETVKVENSLLFASALHKSGVRFELHVYEKGAHGIGLGKGLEPGSFHPWVEDCVFWLNVQGFLESNTAL
jgi:acetyl esterase/lipase